MACRPHPARERGGDSLLLALAVVVNEARAANLSSWLQRRSRAQRASRAAAPAGSARLAWKDVAALSPGQQAAALLRLVLQELIERGLLPDDQSLTNREMLARLGAAGAHAAPFADLAAAADAVVRQPGGGRGLRRCTRRHKPSLAPLLPAPDRDEERLVTRLALAAVYLVFVLLVGPREPDAARNPCRLPRTAVSAGCRACIPDRVERHPRQEPAQPLRPAAGRCGTTRTRQSHDPGVAADPARTATNRRW